jgi:hypothetical protein
MEIADRIGGFDVRKIGATDLDEFVGLCVAKPALHRCGGAMARRVHALAWYVVPAGGLAAVSTSTLPGD